MIIIILFCLLFVAYSGSMSIFRERLFDYYTQQLDDWVSSGGDVGVVQSQVIANCGKLVISQAGVFERLQLVTFYRDEFDFRVDVCLKMTVNRLYKQPEFEKPELVHMICDDPLPYHELFRRLCRRSGLRPPH